MADIVEMQVHVRKDPAMLTAEQAGLAHALDRFDRVAGRRDDNVGFFRLLRARLFGFSAVLIGLALLAAACGGAAGASGGDANGLSVSIASPADGATVSEPFTVKLDASVPLADPSTGEHHVHLCFDGASCDEEYTLVYGNSISVKGLAPGEHTIQASLRNADHSDAGAPTDTITVTVTEASGGNASPAPSGGSGYGY